MICYDIKNNYNMAFLTIWGRLWNKKHTSETQYRITSKKSTGISFRTSAQESGIDNNQ